MTRGEDPPHVERLFGRPAPRPVPGCPVCAQSARACAEFREARDLSAATDAAVLWRDHLSREHH